MPTVMVGAGCAAASGAPAASATARHSKLSWVRMSVPVDPFLGVDPALRVAGLDAARLRAGPGVVGVSRAAELIVDDAEVDQRLRRVAGEVLERGEIVLAQRDRGAVHRDPALGGARRVLVGGRERPDRRAGLARAPLVDRDRLPARRQQLLDLVAEPGLVRQPGG